MNIAILGFGTVGKGVDQIVAGLDGIEVTRILELPDRCEGPRMTSDFEQIVGDPSIEVVLECTVTMFSGILNGTTNYIIDTMAKTGADFDETLARAQELGYAERDPSADIDGIDVRNKTIISASVAFGVACTPDLPVTGMRTITKADMELFARAGRVVKLLGHGLTRDGAYAVAVEPMALPAASLEANVPSNFNLATLEGASIGKLKFYGQGAGSLPTGNAMVQDVLDLASGVRPRYELSVELAYDPTLLAGDYVFRTTAAPEGAEPFDEGAWLVHSLTAVQARALFERISAADPGAFMAKLV